MEPLASLVSRSFTFSKLIFPGFINVHVNVNNDSKIEKHNHDGGLSIII